MEEHVFVYGTLKKGHRMGDWLNANAEFIGKGVTPGLLFDLGAFPGFKKNTDCEGQKQYVGPVFGEVYKVTDPKVMDRMDRYEGVRIENEVDVGLYRKIKVPVSITQEEGGDLVLVDVTVYEYNLNTSKMTPIKGGLWL